MKKTILSTLLLLLSLASFATGQQGDIIVIDGQKWELLKRPIYADSIIYHRLVSILPKNRDENTSNWDGFQAAWSIKAGMLTLDSVLVNMYDKETKKLYTVTKTRKELESVFAYRKTPFVATWFTDTIRAAQGMIVRYEHMGFNRNHERELHLAVKKGRIVGRQLYENKVLVDGFSFQHLMPNELQKRIQIPAARYPEVASSRILFTIKNMKADEKGNLTDCEVKALVKGTPAIPADDKRLLQLADEFKSGLKSIHPWRVLRINGRTFVGDGLNWTIPYRLAEK